MVCLSCGPHSDFWNCFIWFPWNHPDLIPSLSLWPLLSVICLFFFFPFLQLQFGAQVAVLLLLLIASFYKEYNWGTAQWKRCIGWDIGVRGWHRTLMPFPGCTTFHFPIMSVCLLAWKLSCFHPLPRHLLLWCYTLLLFSLVD